MFKKATRKQARLKLGLTGPSGSGKTESALRLAAGLGGRVAVIDTENGSASLYANKYNFDSCELQPPYTVDSYQEAVEFAEKAGYDVIIIDSITHQWAGEGGLLELKEELDARGGNANKNKFSNWGTITKKHEKFKSTILHSPAHIIVTMRSKQEYVLVERDGKQAPQKVGLAPIQRDGLEYELTAVLDIGMDHKAQASKDRTGLFKDYIFQVTEETGQKLKAWLDSGEKETPRELAAEEQKQTPTKDMEKASNFTKEIRKPSEAQIKRLFAIQKNTKWTHDDVKRELKRAYNIDSTKDMTMAQYDEVVDFIQKNDPPQDGPPALDTNEKIS